MGNFDKNFTFHREASNFVLICSYVKTKNIKIKRNWLTRGAVESRILLGKVNVFVTKKFVKAPRQGRLGNKKEKKKKAVYSFSGSP